MLVRGVPPTLARQKDVVLPQPLERGVIELLEPAPNARECSIPAPEVTSDYPGGRAGGLKEDQGTQRTKKLRLVAGSFRGERRQQGQTPA
jgi:hypothetical protein